MLSEVAAVRHHLEDAAAVERTEAEAEAEVEAKAKEGAVTVAAVIQVGLAVAAVLQYLGQSALASSAARPEEKEMVLLRSNCRGKVGIS